MEEKTITKKDLEGMYYLTKEALLFKKELHAIERFLAGKTARLPQIDHLPFAVSADDRAAVEQTAEHLRALLADNAVRCTKQYERLLEFILGIDDSLLRQILLLRYVSCKSWQQIAFAIGEYDEQYPRKYHDRHLKKLLKPE